MSGRRILSDAQIDRMADMRERGRSYSEIAAHFAATGTAISDKTIRWQCLRVGAFPEGKPAPINLRQKPEGSKGTAFTACEDREIIDMQAQGASVAEIARRLNRRQNSVLGRIMTLASYEAYAEAEAA